jgi:hypothetical protein
MYVKIKNLITFPEFYTTSVEKAFLLQNLKMRNSLGFHIQQWINYLVN